MSNTHSYHLSSPTSICSSNNVSRDLVNWKLYRLMKVVMPSVAAVRESAHYNMIQQRLHSQTSSALKKTQ